MGSFYICSEVLISFVWHYHSHYLFWLKQQLHHSQITKLPNTQHHQLWSQSWIISSASIPAPAFEFSVVVVEQWLKINERIEYKVLSLTYKVLITSQHIPTCICISWSLCSLGSIRSSSVDTITRLPSSSFLKNWHFRSTWLPTKQHSTADAELTFTVNLNSIHTSIDFARCGFRYERLPFGTFYERELEIPFLAVLKFRLKTFLFDQALPRSPTASLVIIYNALEIWLLILLLHSRLSVSSYFHSMTQLYKSWNSQPLWKSSTFPPEWVSYNLWKNTFSETSKTDFPVQKCLV